MDILDKLKMVKDDPMWADHSEITKKTLGRAIDEIERLRAQAKRHEAEIEELVEALNSLVENAEGFSVSGVYFNELAEKRKVLDDAYDAIAKYEVKKP